MPKVTIALNKLTGLGTLTYDNNVIKCGGKVGFAYPADTTIDCSAAGAKQKMHLSAQYNNAQMPWSVLWIGQRGVFIHEWPCLENSSGCIHLVAPDAKNFFDWCDGKIRVVFNWF